MKLQNSVTIQPPSFTRPDGTVWTPKPLTMSHLVVIFEDNSEGKSVRARIIPLPMPVVLWQGAEYEAAGDYTQAQAEARLLEKLGPDLKAGLENLYSRASA